MQLESISHFPKSHMAYARDRETIHIRLRAKKGDVTHVDLVYGDKYDWNRSYKRVEMNQFASDQLYDYYQVEVKPPNLRLSYAFYLMSDFFSIYYTEKGLTHELAPHATGCFHYPFLNAADVNQPPQWVKDAVFYQIFPERFANGDPSLNPENVEHWDAKPKQDNFFGGDIQGVMNHIDYLHSLGITAIYFTPLFQATTNHKYDTIDYMQVDPQFGNNDTLKKLVRRCHERGIRVILDAVFNHSGYYFQPFQDVLTHQENSAYTDWFYLSEFPVKKDPSPNYGTFAFEYKMPKLNTEQPELKAYLLDVARYWIEEVGIDGWRLDVANEVDHQFWREFRATVKSIKPDAYILGEIWHNAHPWLQGDQFDAVMNYPVTDSILNFFCYRKTNASTFMQEINHIQAIYSEPVNEAAFNLLDSHDTARLLTTCQEDKRKMKAAATFQLTYQGTPCIFYGDEVGLTGGDDPDCRKTMIWDEEKQDQDLLSFYKKMIHLRNEHAALRDGSFRFLMTQSNDPVIAYERKNDSETFVVFINAGDVSSYVLTSLEPGKYDEVFSNESYDASGGSLHINVPAFSSLILQRIQESFRSP
ncbi:glycosidase [Geomicrobium halophilum]|uniref:Glycosidase n=1 Tax=Geomicrobium halophilum TaxID=549000 RepID=A0A841PMP5_9BACL|nr:alpha-glycosidase [Geomicrobium halophilum]MBB6450030.1 glycosidase [Geomicrobium halophilum]